MQKSIYSRRRLCLLLGGATLLALLGTPAGQSGAEFVKYTDERGVIHFTDNASRVPENYRRALEPVEFRAPEEGVEEPTEKGAATEEGEAFADAVTRRLVGIARQNAASPETLEMIEVLEGWLNTWGLAYMLSGIPFAVVTLVSGFHALRHRRFLWALGHAMAWPIVIPIYLLTQFDSAPMGGRVAMLVVWTAPFVVGGLAMRAVWVQFSGGAAG